MDNARAWWTIAIVGGIGIFLMLVNDGIERRIERAGRDLWREACQRDYAVYLPESDSFEWKEADGNE